MSISKRTVAGSLILILTLSIFFSAINMSSAATQVSGILSSDTTWTQAESPYNLNGDLLVDNGVTLTIEAGVTVNLNGYTLIVNGTLHAIGNEDRDIEINAVNDGHITFTKFSTNWNEAASTGCIIENAILNNTQTSGDHGVILDIINAPKISNNIIYGSITSQPDASITSETVIVDNTIFGRITVYTKTIVRNNMILTGGINFGPGVGDCSSVLIEGNTIAVGFGITMGAVSMGITGNPIIRNNVIKNNQNGIQLSMITISYGSVAATIINNTITNNGNGIVFTTDNMSPAEIHNNNIYNNTNYAIKLDGFTYDVNAIENWWGTTDTASINQAIYDYTDSFSLGRVTYTPILSALNPQAPTIPVLTITATAGNDGSISPDGFVSVEFANNQTFTVTPDFGYHVENLIIDGTSLGAVDSYTLTTIIANNTVEASFAINTYNITASAGTGGSISPSGKVSVTHGENQTFTVTPDTGYQIDSVLIDGAPATAPYTFTNVTSEHTISATFQSTSSASPSPSPTSTPTIPEFTFPITILMLAMITLVTMVVLRAKNKVTLNL